MTERIPRSNILVVESERNLSARIDWWFGDQYGVFTAHSGQEALELYDDDVAITFVQAALCDREIDEYLAKEPGGRTVLLSPESPDEIESGFDSHLQQPLERREFPQRVEYLIKQAHYEKEIQRWFGLLSKKAELEAESGFTELRQSSEYTALLRHIEEYGQRASTSRDEIPGERFDAVFREPGHTVS